MAALNVPLNTVSSLLPSNTPTVAGAAALLALIVLMEWRSKKDK